MSFTVLLNETCKILVIVLTISIIYGRNVVVAEDERMQ